MSDRRTWRVTVTSPTGLTDEGSLTIIGNIKGPDQRKLAGSLSDMTWRIAMDLYGQEEEADEREHTDDPNRE